MTGKGLRLPFGVDVGASALAALAFFGAATAMALLAHSSRHLTVIDVALVAMLALLIRLEYPIGKGSAVPAQLAFVPMLFLMPLRFVPLAVGAASLLASVTVLASGRRPHPCPNALGACWFALPPAIILQLAGEKPFAWHHWPLYVAVFAVQSLTDLGVTVAYEGIVNRVALRPLLEVLGTTYSFDALLTPVAMVSASEGSWSFLALLPFTVVLYVLGRERRIRLDAQSEAERLGALALADDLTRAANRRSFEDRLEVEVARAARTGVQFSVCLLDLDHFKRFNDTFGHPAGDDLLRRVADSWAATLRADDMLARVGGEEFGLILPDAAPDIASAVVERLRAVTPAEITVSVGVATWKSGEMPAEVVARADAALYRAKDEGRDRLVLAA